VPLLLVFENAPKSVELRKENGKLRFMVSFPSRTGRLALLPLFGHDVRKAADTEEWLREFPAEVKKQCDAWAEDLREFPVDVEETVTYDETGDRVTFTEAFEYVTLGSGGKKLAPLQGMLALGYSQGLPVKFSAEPMDMNVATQFGPTMVISGTGYSWSLEGLGKRVFGRQILGPSTAASKALEKELVEEVDRVVEAGHLAPWIYRCRKFSYGYFYDPSENLYLLSELLPALPDDRQASLRRYLRSEYAKYPPHRIRELDEKEGARRETEQEIGFTDSHDLRYRVLSPFDYIPMPSYRRGKDGILMERMPVLYRANGVARYYRAVGQRPSPEALAAWREAMQKSLEHRLWDTMGWFWGKYTTSARPSTSGTVAQLREANYTMTIRQVHRDAAGLIGYINLCQMAGVKTESEAWGQLARLTALRFGLARYGRYMASSRLFRMPTDPDMVNFLSRSGDFTRPENHVQQVLSIDQHCALIQRGATKELSGHTYWYTYPFYLVTFQDLTFEVARILADYGLQDDVRRVLKRFDEIQPVWHSKFANLVYTCGVEGFAMYPSDSHQLFMGHAWIAGTEPGKLEEYLGIPWEKTGDLFFMHKLAETIKAYRGVKWVP